MKRRAVTPIITLIIYGTYVLPLLQTRSGSDSEFIGRDSLILNLLIRLPVTAVILLLSLTGSPDDRRRRGWRIPSPADLLTVLPLYGFTLVLGLSGFFSSTGTVPDLTGSVGILIPVLLLSITGAIGEELFFRSWMISEFSSPQCGRIPVMIISTVLFALIHAWQGWHGILFAAVSGLVYALTFHLRNSVLPLIVAHAAHNFTSLMIAADMF